MDNIIINSKNYNTSSAPKYYIQPRSGKILKREVEHKYTLPPPHITIIYYTMIEGGFGDESPEIWKTPGAEDRVFINSLRPITKDLIDLLAVYQL